MRLTITTPPKCLLRNEQGMAAVEFALISPILILLFFGAIELTNLLIADSKLRNVASSAADLVTQKSTGQITAADLNIVNIAVTEIMRPLAISTGSTPLVAVRITNYRPTSETVTGVNWTRTIFGGGTNPVVTDQLGLVNPTCGTDDLPTSLRPKTATSPLNDVVRVTARYNWAPTFANIFNSNIMLEATNYNMPRYSLNLNAGTGISPPCP